MAHSSCWHLDKLYHINCYNYIFCQSISYIFTSLRKFLKNFPEQFINFWLNEIWSSAKVIYLWKSDHANTNMLHLMVGTQVMIYLPHFNAQWWASTQSMIYYTILQHSAHLCLTKVQCHTPSLQIRTPWTSQLAVPSLQPYPITIINLPMFICDLPWPPLMQMNLGLTTTVWYHLLFNCWV